MSKYIDKDKVLEYIIFGVVGKDITCGELTRAIESLPTIEVSEEVLKATKKFNAYTIADKNADMGMRTMIEPIVEVSEDCISREWLVKALDNLDWYDFDMFYKVVENAPSVVVRNNRTTAEPQTYITEDRDTQILDAWQVHHRNTTTVKDEPTTEQSSMVTDAMKKENA